MGLKVEANEIKSQYHRDYRHTPEGKAILKANKAKWVSLHKEELKEPQKLYGESQKHLKKVFPGVPKNYVIHHGFGKSPTDFLLLPASLHMEMHKTFGKRNDKCLYDNIEVRDFLVGHLIYIVHGTDIRVPSNVELF